MEKTVICVVDRIEEGVAICFADQDGAKITFPIGAFTAIREGDALSITVAVQNGQQTVLHLRPATPEEHRDRKLENAQRLRRLFDKNT